MEKIHYYHYKLLLLFWPIYSPIFISNNIFLTAFCTADIGPVPIICGSTPVHAEDIIRARGGNPLFLASSSFIITTAAAPSFMEEEFPAVTLPVPSC